ncbi:hypothetical protein K1719_034862 [Acacia pycnantha]|nr:hypothetical protein K1719_034862 [Acacia pycnantha]
METQIRPRKLQKTSENRHRRRCRKWQHLLPQDISESILRRLCLSDYLNFGLVCSSWNDMLKTAMKNKQCHPNPQIPQLLMCPKWSYSLLNPFFLDLNKNTIVHPKRRLYPTSQGVVGTVDGWLIMSKVTKTYILPFFFNPVSRRRFWLPLMNDMSYHKIRKMVANSAPNNINNHHHDHVDPTFVVCLTYDRIMYCKITDKSWSLIKSWRRGINCTSDIAVIGNLLYVTRDETRSDDINIYYLNSPTMAARKLVVLDPKPVVSVFDDIYLAHDEVSGDLMLVVATYDPDCIIRSLLGDGGDHKSINDFRVMKMDRNRRGGNDGVRWVEVEDLGDCLIFLDQKNCRLISTVGLQMMENVTKNCIYFADGTEIRVFCLSDKKFHSFHVSESDGSTQSVWNHCLWFTPKLN